MSKLIQQLEAIGQNAALRNQHHDLNLLNQLEASNEDKTIGLLVVPETDCQALLFIGE